MFPIMDANNYISKPTKSIKTGDVIRREVRGVWQDVTVDYVTAARERGYLVAICKTAEGYTHQTGLGHKSGDTLVRK